MNVSEYISLLIAFLFISIGSQDINVLKSCDPKIPTQLTWTPKILRTGTTYNINFNYDGKEIKLCLKVWQIGDNEPIFDSCDKHICKDFYKYILLLFKDATCPWKLNPINITRRQFLDYEVPVLEGDFRLYLDITDIKTNQRIVCLEGEAFMVE